METTWHRDYRATYRAKRGVFKTGDRTVQRTAKAKPEATVQAPLRRVYRTISLATVILLTLVTTARGAALGCMKRELLISARRTPAKPLWRTTLRPQPRIPPG